MFAPALAEGLTTLLVAGKDEGPVGGRIAAIKTGASSLDAMVVRAVVGQRFQHDAIGPDAIKPLRDQLDRGKKYVEQWRQYEKALAEWKAGRQPTAPPPAPVPEARPAEDPITGTWEAEIDLQGQIRLTVVLELKLEGTKVSGQVRVSFGQRDLPPQEASGTFESGRLKIEFRGMGGSATLDATVEGDSMQGKLSLGRAGEQDFAAKRTGKAKPTAALAASAPTAQKATTDDGKPKPPKVDETLEPLRAAIEARGALVVRASRAAAIVDVIELLTKEQIPFVLADAEDLADDPAVAGAHKPFVLLGPGVVEEDEGTLRNAAQALADRDVPILFGSGDCAGARFLPLHAAYAVRYGLSPTDALAALTIAPARAFRIDDRIGSLEKGKDADFVVFSGDPFEPQSRVLLVVCNGAVVVDRREGNR
jgi:hypothetical protein